MRMIRSFCAVILLSLAGIAAAAETQFDGNCAMSAALGSKNTTDCSVFWISPDDKLYCFSSASARSMFLQNAQRNEQLAKAFWENPEFWAKLKRENN
jgi:hypothetical protein